MAGSGGQEDGGGGEASRTEGARVEGGRVANRFAPGAGGTGDGEGSDQPISVGEGGVGPGWKIEPSESRRILPEELDPERPRGVRIPGSQRVP